MTAIQYLFSLPLPSPTPSAPGNLLLDAKELDTEISSASSTWAEPRIPVTICMYRLLSNTTIGYVRPPYLHNIIKLDPLQPRKPFFDCPTFLSGLVMSLSYDLPSSSLEAPCLSSSPTLLPPTANTSSHRRSFARDSMLMDLKLLGTKDKERKYMVPREKGRGETEGHHYR